MKRKAIRLFCLLLCTVFILLDVPIVSAESEEAIAPEIEWISRNSTDTMVYANDIRQTKDGGYILTGSNAGENMALLIKLTSEGRVEWYRLYGGELGDTVQTGESVCENDYGFAFTGYKTINKKKQIYVTQTDPDGNRLWSRIYGNSWAESGGQGYSIQKTDDGGLVVTGYLFSSSISDGYPNTYLLKTDETGDMIWEKVVGGGTYDKGLYVQQTEDKGYIVSGSRTYKTTNPGGDITLPIACLYKFSDAGALMWENSYKGLANDRQDYANCVRQTDDGGYIVTGETGDEQGYYNMYLLRTDANGSVIWEKGLNKQKETIGYSVVQTADKGFVATGITRMVTSKNRIYIVKTDNLGNVVWDIIIANEDIYDSVSAMSMQQTKDGGFIIAGSGKYNGNQDILVVKLEPEPDQVIVKGAAFLDMEGCTMNILASANCLDDGDLTSDNVEYSEATYIIRDSDGNSLEIEGTLSYNQENEKWEAVGIDVSSVIGAVFEAEIEFTDENGHTGKYVATAIAEAEMHISSPNTFEDGRVLITATLLDVEEDRITSGSESVYVRIGDEYILLADNGNGGDMHEKDGVYSIWKTMEHSVSDLRLYLGEDVCDAVSVDIVHSPELVVVTDFKALYDNYISMRVGFDQDIDNNEIIDYYEVINALYDYAKEYNGIVIDLKQEITTEKGFNTDYRLMEYGVDTLQMNRLIDQLIHNISTRTAFKNIVLVGDDKVVPYYRRISPLSDEKNYPNDIGGTFDNATLLDTSRNFIMTDVPYATYNSMDPDLINYPHLNAGFGRIFSSYPINLYNTISTRNTIFVMVPGQITAGILSLAPDTVDWPAVISNVLMPVMDEYDLHEGDLEADVVPGKYYHFDGQTFNWGPQHVNWSVLVNRINFLFTHACHISAEANDGVNITYETLPQAPGSILITAGCHSGYTTSSSPSVPALYNSFALSALNRGISYMAPTSYGYGSNVGVGYHDLLEQQFAKALVHQNTIGQALIQAYHQYWDRILPNSNDAINIYAAYGLGYYGLPTQAIFNGGTEGRSSMRMSLNELNAEQIQSSSAALSEGMETDNTNLSVTIPAIEALDVGGRALFTFEGGGEYLIEAYAPIAPLYIKTFIYPDGTRINGVTLADEDKYLYDDGSNVDLVLNVPVNKTIGEIHGTKELTGLYPENVFWWDARETDRGLELILTMVPVQHDYDAKVTSLYTRMDFTVDLELPGLPEDKTLMSVSAPTSITGVKNGMAKTAEALGLPDTVTLITNEGTVSAGVSWNIEGCSYDPYDTDAQIFTVDGNVSLPEDVINPNDVSLSISIEVTVKAATSHTGGYSKGGGKKSDPAVNNQPEDKPDLIEKFIDIANHWAYRLKYCPCCFGYQVFMHVFRNRFVGCRSDIIVKVLTVHACAYT
jgi:hypothetical protein